VYDTAAVCGLQGLRELNGHSSDAGRLEGTLPDDGVQRPACHVLHGDEGRLVRLLHRVDGADVGVVQRRRGSGFPQQATSTALRIADLSQDLDGDRALQSRVARLVRHTHAAGP
jgi:hypothetical protein